MPKPKGPKKKPSAKSRADTAGGPSENAAAGKNPAAVALGRLGGLKGGKARAESLTPSERSQAARAAANSRWNRPKD